MTPPPEDKSNGYEQVAEQFMRRRNARIGAAAVREWSKTLPRGAAVLDLGCGHGVPISQALFEEGFAVHGIDASARMIAAFHERFPHAPAECAAAEDSQFFGRTFDGVIAWGLLFLLPGDIQGAIIHKVAGALRPGGRFLFTSPREAVTWIDTMTERESVSLGFQAYQELLLAAGLRLVCEQTDEGDNFYYLAGKP